MDDDLSTAHPLYTRDYESSHYDCEDDSLKNLLRVLSRDNILIYLLDTSTAPLLAEARNAITTFASSIDVISANNLSMQPTIDALRNEETRDAIRDFVCNTDPSFQDFFYDEDTQVPSRFLSPFSSEGHKSLNERQSRRAGRIEYATADLLRLILVYKDQSFPSYVFDSHGARKMEALAGYVERALRNGRVLVIDDLDSGLHFHLTRSIIAPLTTSAMLRGS